ncbi:hypothetical protein OEA41_000783 [Lepraria neglecta]|uniref:Uncharacterized protein n=1 Tax=Lepraria neglecta TaxID=209136 RepID=A0AAE0DPS5_9LECA|nr:hypothetical protein OEA41_000783 [Lepraria neglecta]
MGGLTEHLKTAATQWRLPYWDWAQQWKNTATDQAVYRVPHIVRDKELYIATSTGWTKVSNPMYQFVMPNKEPMGKHGIHSYKTPTSSHFDYGTPFEKCYGTSRWVDTPVNSTIFSADFIEGAQNHAKIEAALTGHDWYENGDFEKELHELKFKDTLAEAVYRFFSEEYFTDYGSFASTCHDPTPKKSLRISFHLKVYITMRIIGSEEEPWLDKYKDSDGTPNKTKCIDDVKKQLSDLYFTSTNLYLKHGNGGLGVGSGYFEDYVVNVVYDRFELDGLPFCIYILLKPVENVSLVNQHMDPDHVGIVYNFSTPTPRTGDVTCTNCNRQREAKALSTGQVPITSALIYRVKNKEIDLPSMKTSSLG